ncbi:MAG: hypothetical protein Q7J48_11535, partial [Nocardioides sp.]|nr:hypothetical protein [Nocardioides sp.]
AGTVVAPEAAVSQTRLPSASRTSKPNPHQPGDEAGRHHHAGRVEDDLEPAALGGGPDPAVAAVVDQQQRQRITVS